MKTIILKGAAWVTCFIFILSACLLDVAFTSLPVVVCIISGCGLVFFAYANDLHQNSRDGKKVQRRQVCRPVHGRNFSRADIIDLHCFRDEEERLNA